MAFIPIGKIRPTGRGQHDPIQIYEVLDMVMSADGTRAYIAKQDVPSGTALNNTNYWAELLNLAPRFQQLANEAIEAAIEELPDRIVDIALSDDVRSDAPWSSEKTVQAFCPPFTATGNPVICHPMAGSPLSVQIETEQTGDIRIVRCGKNVAAPVMVAPITYSTTAGSVITRTGLILPGGTTYTVSADRYENISIYTNIIDIATETALLSSEQIGVMYPNMGAGRKSKTFTCPAGSVMLVYSGASTNTAGMIQILNNCNVQVEIGESVTDYEPYDGDDYTVSVPDGFTGDSLDAPGILAKAGTNALYASDAQSLHVSGYSDIARMLSSISELPDAAIGGY